MGSEMCIRDRSIRRNPGGRTLTVHVEYESSDRHRRVPAIVDHFIPSLISKLGHVHAKCDQDVEGMARRHRALGQRAAQVDRLGLAVAAALEFSFEQIEKDQFLAFTESCMVGDVIGGSYKIVEGENQGPVARANDPRRDREIFVAVSLAGSQFARGVHQKLATFFGLRMLFRVLRMRTDRKPHIGEYDTKTNAIYGFSQGPATPELGR